MNIVNEFKNHLEDFDFCASKFDDAWCEHVSPLGPEFVSDWLSTKGIDLEDDQLELILELSGLVLGAFRRSLAGEQQNSDVLKRISSLVDDNALLRAQNDALLRMLNDSS